MRIRLFGRCIDIKRSKKTLARGFVAYGGASYRMYWSRWIHVVISRTKPLLILLAVLLAAPAEAHPVRQCELKAIAAASAFIAAHDALERTSCYDCGDHLKWGTLEIPGPPKRIRLQRDIEKAQKELQCLDRYEQCIEEMELLEAERDSALVWLREVAENCVGRAPDPDEAMTIPNGAVTVPGDARGNRVEAR